MRGITLLEFLVAISIFSVIVFLSYHAFEEQRSMLKRVESSARPETESNFRMLIIKHLLERSSTKVKADPFLDAADKFFPDLSFGSQPDSTKFSAAIAVGQPLRFLRSGSSVMVATSSPVETGKTYLLAGSDSTGDLAWRYERCEKISNSPGGLILQLASLQTPAPVIEKGILIETEVHGFVYQNNILFWVSPGGATQPYFNDLDSFEYTWGKPLLTIRWQKGEMQTEFRCEL